MTRTISTKIPQMSLKSVRSFMEILEQDHPDAKTELVFHSPFQLLVSVVLSAQATDKSVNKATAPLFAVAPTPQLMTKLGEEGIASYIRTIGLWRSKSHNVALLCQQLLERHNGEIPRTREALEALPGVGRKTANVVLNVAFGEPTMAVDTHIFRVSNRTGLAPGKNVRAVEDALLARIPDDLMPNAHHCLILHGRYLCKARTPECWRCRAKDLCLYKEKNLYPPHKTTRSS